MELEELKKIASEMSILVVEDEIEIQTYLIRFLSRLFGLVDSANNGDEALKKYRQNKYDIVITDIKMPQMDGLKLIGEIRNINKHQPIIVSSAHNESCLLIELLNDGVSGFILKPIVIHNVVSTLLRVCTTLHEKKMLIYYVKEMERLEAELAAMQSCPI
jgi:YesN/AraC family two-component response regulator